MKGFRQLRRCAMERKHIFIILLCLSTLNNFAYAIVLYWSPANSNWCDSQNWGGTLPSAGDRAYVEGNPPYPVIGSGCNAVCKSLEVNPWGWDGSGAADVTVTIDGGNLDANCIALSGSSTQFEQSWEPQMNGNLIVNSGNITIYDGVPAYEDEDSPPDPYYGGRGLWIGGGSTSWWPWAVGHVVMNGGTLTTPKIAIYNGDITLNGGLLYDTNDSANEFIIRDEFPDNKIYINGGTLRLAGDKVSVLNDLIEAQRIVSENTFGLFVGPTYNAGDDYTELTSIFIPGVAWQPSPANHSADVRFIGGLTLSWSPGDWVAAGEPNGHYVFLGTVFDDVTTAGVGTAGTASAVFRGRVDTNNMTIAEVNLVPSRTYYWRVDEVNDPCTHKGIVWEFKTISEKARDPSPADGGGLKMPLALTWTAGDWTDVHRVYFGTSYGSVNAANTNTPLIYRGTATISYPLSDLFPDFVLASNTTYYWRVDSKNILGSYTAAGKSIWSFNTGDSTLIEDFQSYDTSAELKSVWVEAPVVCSGNKAGSGQIALIREGASYRYMQFAYDKTGGTGGRYYSEVAYPFGSPADFTGGGVLALIPDTLELKYRGFAINSADPDYDRMYVAIEDVDGDVSVTLNPDAEAQKTGVWTQWDIAYSDLNDQNPSTDINKVSVLYLGAGARCQSLYLGGGDGNVMFDDIELKWREPWCWPPEADFDGDCDVDIYDLEILAGEWLYICEWVWPPIPPVEPNEPILWYKFDETSGTAVTDYGTGDANDYTGEVINYSGTLTWDSAGDCNGNGAIYLPPGTQNSYVEATASGNPLWWIEESNGVTFSIWINADMTAYDEFSSWSGVFGAWNSDISSETIEVHCPSPWPPGYEGGPACIFVNRNSDGPTAETGALPASDFGGRWNNWVFVHDRSVSPEEMRVYHNGELVADANTNDGAGCALPLTPANIGSFRIGTRHEIWGNWAGEIDDFRIWNYPLSEEEILWVATSHCPIYHLDPVCVANIKPSPPGELETVDFYDFALLAEEWLVEVLQY